VVKLKGGPSAKKKLFNDLDDYFKDPTIFGNATPEELHQYLHENGFDPKPLSDGGLKGKPYTEGGGYKVNWGGDKILEYHPGGKNHHGNIEYYKLSSGPTRKMWFDKYGKSINPRK
jgi:hypothetical protein